MLVPVLNQLFLLYRHMLSFDQQQFITSHWRGKVSVKDIRAASYTQINISEENFRSVSPNLKTWGIAWEYPTQWSSSSRSLTVLLNLALHINREMIFMVLVCCTGFIPWIGIFPRFLLMWSKEAAAGPRHYHHRRTAGSVFPTSIWQKHCLFTRSLRQQETTLRLSWGRWWWWSWRGIHVR